MEYGMIQQHHILSHAYRQHQFWSRFEGKVPHFLPNAAQKVACPGTLFI
jgi:hypothetical protein